MDRRTATQSTAESPVTPAEPVSAEALRQLIDVAQAIAILDATPVEPIVTIDVDLGTPEEQMTANVLAQDVVADRDLPPFDKSLVDGFAVASLDGPWHAVGEVIAGTSLDRQLARGEAVAIMTGAPIPHGTVAVVPVEQASIREGIIHLIVPHPLKPRQFVQPRGADVRAGEPVLSRGTLIGPAQLAVLASVGVTRASVVGDPIAHMLVTGDEVIDASETPVGAQIRDANGPMLVSLLRHLGAMPRMSRVRDDRDSLRAAIDGIAAEADVLLLSGGVSMGSRDFVPDVLRELGFDLKITKVRMKPGKPFVFATRERAGKTDYVFGLPGNPVSSFVCALRFASRILRRLRGLPPADGTIHATLATPLPANGPREFYQPATIHDGVATPLNWRGSSDVFTLAKADVLIIRPADEPARAAAELVQCISIPR